MRTIQLICTINGLSITGGYFAEIYQSSYLAADRFSIGLVIGADPLLTSDYIANLGAENITIGVSIGTADILTAPSKPLISGLIDNIDIDFRNNIVVMSGRDLSARLIDLETQENFSNQTSSQIANFFAESCGLQSNITRTTTPVGQYYELTHSSTSLGLHSRRGTAWSFLAWLADQENFQLSVSGNILNFGPVQIPPTALNLNWGTDLISLTIDRATGLNAPVVTVHSWNTRAKSAVSASVGSGVMKTVLIRPNLSADRVQKLAKQAQSTQAMHEILVCGEMPGETILTPGMTINLSGTNSSYDRGYNIVELIRRVDLRSGFSQNFKAQAIS
ncbi:MAG TPA: hypothetical protein PLC74_00280 [Acetobacteraceae bacterium]|nr:hypothetical protein [Acetobacteraceae bacterium]